MAEVIKDYINNNEEWSIDDRIKMDEITSIADNDRENEYYITLDDDNYVYRLWKIKPGEDEFYPEDNDMIAYGTSCSMYYCSKKNKWSFL